MSKKSGSETLGAAFGYVVGLGFTAWVAFATDGALQVAALIMLAVSLIGAGVKLDRASK